CRRSLALIAPTRSTIASLRRFGSANASTSFARGFTVSLSPRPPRQSEVPSECHPDRRRPVPTGVDRSGPVLGSARLPRNGERVTGVEPATLCLASTRSSQLSYTRKSEEVLVLPRL